MSQFLDGNYCHSFVVQNCMSHEQRQLCISELRPIDMENHDLDEAELFETAIWNELSKLSSKLAENLLRNPRTLIRLSKHVLEVTKHTS